MIQGNCVDEEEADEEDVDEEVKADVRTVLADELVAVESVEKLEELCDELVPLVVLAVPTVWNAAIAATTIIMATPRTPATIARVTPERREPKRIRDLFVSEPFSLNAFAMAGISPRQSNKSHEPRRPSLQIALIGLARPVGPTQNIDGMNCGLKSRKDPLRGDLATLRGVDQTGGPGGTRY